MRGGLPPGNMVVCLYIKTLCVYRVVSEQNLVFLGHQS